MKPYLCLACIDVESFDGCKNREYCGYNITMAREVFVLGNALTKLKKEIKTELMGIITNTADVNAQTKGEG